MALYVSFFQNVAPVIVISNKLIFYECLAMRKKVVCVVDDHGFVNDLVKTCFSSLFGEEFEFRYFSSGNQFSEYLDLDEEELDIVFLDMKMDDGDGVSVLNKLSSLHKNEVPLFIFDSIRGELSELYC